MLILLAIAVCVVTGLLAARKGYSFFLWALAGGIVGLLVLAFLPYANAPRPPAPGAGTSKVWVSDASDRGWRRIGNVIGAVLSILAILLTWTQSDYIARRMRTRRAFGPAPARLSPDIESRFRRMVHDSDAKRKREDESNSRAAAPLLNRIDARLTEMRRDEAEEALVELRRVYPRCPRIPEIEQAVKDLRPLKERLLLDLGGGTRMEFVCVWSGEFWMGDDAGAPGERPSHRVVIPRPVYLARTEVTQEQWRAVMGTDPSMRKQAGSPVEQVSWDDCQAFVAKLSSRPDQRVVRLPAEAEWEYAYRAGGTGRWPWGDTATDGESVHRIARAGTHAWYSGNAGESTHTVGAREANAWGFQDMGGNVWEWCADSYGAYGAGDWCLDPRGARSGSIRVLRGGSFSLGADFLRSGFRVGEESSTRNRETGFRCAVDLTGPELAVVDALEAWGRAMGTAEADTLTKESPEQWREAQEMAQSGLREARAGRFDRAADGLSSAAAKLREATSTRALARLEEALGSSNWLKAGTAICELEGILDADPRLPLLRKRYREIPAPANEVSIDLGSGVVMEFLLVPAGRITLRQDRPGGRRVSREIVNPRPFYMGKYEVTQEQWRVLDPGSGKEREDPSKSHGTRNPVEQVTFPQCRSVIQALAFRASGEVFSLPTPTQWEFAFRAGTGADRTNDGELDGLAGHEWYAENAGGAPHPVGTLEPNPLGLHDMGGNVREWCISDEMAKAWLDDNRAAEFESPEAAVKRALRRRNWGVPDMISGGGWDSPATWLKGDLLTRPVSDGTFSSFSAPTLGLRCTMACRGRIRPLSIRVVDLEGRGVPECRVSVTGPNFRETALATDPEGRVTLHGIGEEEIRIRAAPPPSVRVRRDEGGGIQVEEVSSLPQGMIMPAPATVMPRGEEITLELRRGGPRTGRVLHSQDKPVRGARVYLKTAGGYVCTAKSDVEGRFTVWVPLGDPVAEASCSSLEFRFADLSEVAIPGEGEILFRGERLGAR